MTKAQAAEVQSNETVAEIAAMSASIAPTAEFMTDEVKSAIARQVADGIASALPAVMAEMMKSFSDVPAGTIFTNPASPVVNVSLAPTALAKQNYLKHYRLDGTVSGKYQMIDVKKMNDNDLSIGESIIKGRWVHFASDNFYAMDDKEVAFVEYLIEKQGVKIYEDTSGVSNMARCAVEGCGKLFGDEETLLAHLKATHGVTSANA